MTSAHVILTADMAVIANHIHNPKILLVKREKWPCKGDFVLPGGRVEPGETSMAAAIRELQEETGLIISPHTNAFMEELGFYDKPGRDPRPERHVSAAYIAFVDELTTVTAGDDAADAGWFTDDEIIQMPIGFDHREIIHDAFQRAWED